MADSKFLNPLNNTQNPLRAIGVLAKKIEEDTSIGVVRCNVGDPTGPTLEASNSVMSNYYEHRDSRTGYTEHAGHPSWLVTLIIRLGNRSLPVTKGKCILLS